jgi:hypothetical protein
VRIIAGNNKAGAIFTTDLTPLRTAQFPFDRHGAALDRNMTAAGEVRVTYFGRN